jgi:hypothetical protein
VKPSPETRWIDGMGDAAKAWLAALGSVRTAQYPFDGAARQDWHFVPRARPGLALRDMTTAQRGAAAALLKAGLSANDANHVHSLWRDPSNDFGRDDLGAHYANAHAAGTGR